MCIQLFIRSKKGIAFTSAGNRLLSYANKVLRQHVYIRNYVKNSDTTVTGTIEIGCPATFFEKYLIHIIEKFNIKYPDVSFSLISGISSNLHEKLSSGEIQISILCGIFLGKKIYSTF